MDFLWFLDLLLSRFEAELAYELGIFLLGVKSMRVFISGGCKNGKSTYAQNYAHAQGEPLYYIATMDAVDHEDVERIRRHRAERVGMGFITIEQPTRIEEVLEKCDVQGSFLLDSLTALLANEMFSSSGSVDESACKRVADGVVKVLERVRNIVIVSDYIYSDAMLYDPLTQRYRKDLAHLDRVAAQYSDAVLEIAYTQIITHKSCLTNGSERT